MNFLKEGVAQITMAHYIEIKKEQLSKLISAAYDLSVPVGMGFLHYQEGPLPEYALNDILNKFELGLIKVDQESDYPSVVLNLDYVFGRQVKLSVLSQGGKILIDNSWYDHSDEVFQQLLKRIGGEES